jgi:hypothetical protein
MYIEELLPHERIEHDIVRLQQDIWRLRSSIRKTDLSPAMFELLRSELVKVINDSWSAYTDLQDAKADEP